MCNIWAKEHNNRELVPSELENFFKNSNNLYWVGITGGEPFLREDLIEIIKIILSHTINLSALHFATNGTQYNRIAEIVRHIRDKYPKLNLVFTISIDGPSFLHDKIRGRDGVWQEAAETFKYLKGHKNVKPQIGFTLSNSNIGRFQETFSALKDVYPAIRFDDITINIFQRSGFYYENQKMPALDEQTVIREIKRILEMDKDRISLNNFLRRRYLVLYLKYLKNKKSPVKCQSFSSTCFLDPYGNLFPCAVYQRKMLNIKESNVPLARIWKTPSAKRMGYECSHNKCPVCWSPCDAYSAIGGSLIQSFLTV